MLRRTLVTAAALALIAGPVSASGKKEGEVPKTDVGQYVDLAPVGLPIVVDGQVVNYVFVYVRVNLTGSANVSRWREKEPAFRDALVRAGHRTPFTIKGDYQKIDVPRLVASLTRDATAITGPGVIKSVVVTSQAPQHRARLPAANSANRAPVT